ncbi:hypothetical protein WDU94_010382 [Cyamophila willieti]
MILHLYFNSFPFYYLSSGCKIKALRAKTNTYIKTPVRGEEPVFVVTGRKEDVGRAKREILSAADHFSALRASRKSGALSPLSPPTGVPGHVTIEVRVPYKVVGLVVGPKGATIKRIQHQTNTYIVTPSRDKEPVFEVTGAPDSVEIARTEIESHIIRRTGSCITPTDTTPGALDNGADLLASLCNSGLGLGSILNYVNGANGGVGAGTNDFGGPGGAPFSMLPSSMTNSQGSRHMFSSSSGCSSASSSTSSHSASHNIQGGLDLGSIWSSSLDKDEGLGSTSPSFDSSVSPVNPSSSSIWSYPPLASSTSPSGSLAGSRLCYVCGERDVTHALIPCGHNFFCGDCAERTVTCGTSEGYERACCPMCRVPVSQAMRIIS